MIPQESESIKSDFNLKSILDNLDDQDYNNSLDGFLKDDSLVLNSFSTYGSRTQVATESTSAALSNQRTLNNREIGTFPANTYDLHNVDMHQLDIPRGISELTRQSSAESSAISSRGGDSALGFQLQNNSFSKSTQDTSSMLNDWDRSVGSVFSSDAYSSTLNGAAKQFKPAGLATVGGPLNTDSGILRYEPGTGFSEVPSHPSNSSMSVSVQDYESAFLDYRSAQGTQNPGTFVGPSHGHPQIIPGQPTDREAGYGAGYRESNYPGQLPPPSHLRPDREAFVPGGINRRQFGGPSGSYRHGEPPPMADVPPPYHDAPGPYDYDPGYDYRDEYEGEYDQSYGPPAGPGGGRGGMRGPGRGGPVGPSFGQPFNMPPGRPFREEGPGFGAPPRGYPRGGPPPMRRPGGPAGLGRRGEGPPGYGVNGPYDERDRGYYPPPGPYRPDHMAPPPHMAPEFGRGGGPQVGHGGFHHASGGAYDPMEDEPFSLTVGAVVKRDSLLGGCGWWISDSNKVITVHGSAPVQQAYPSHVRLEYESLLNGLKAAYLKHVRVLLVRSSSEIILTLLRHQNFPFFRSLYAFLSDITDAIDKLLPQFKQLDLELITKEQNYYAHKLAGDVVVSFNKRRENKLFPVPITPPTVPVPANLARKSSQSATSSKTSVSKDDRRDDTHDTSSASTGESKTVVSSKTVAAVVKAVSAKDEPAPGSMESIMAQFGFPSRKI